MINAAYATKLAAEEIADTLIYSGLTSDYNNVIVKDKDPSGKRLYILNMRDGVVKVLGHKKIYVNGDLCKSANEAKYVLQMEYVK